MDEPSYGQEEEESDSDSMNRANELVNSEKLKQLHLRMPIQKMNPYVNKGLVLQTKLRQNSSINT